MDGKNVLSLAVGAVIGVVVAKPLKRGVNLLASAVSRKVKTIEYATKAEKAAEEKPEAAQPKKGSKTPQEKAQA